MSLTPTPEEFEAWRLSLADEELFGKNNDSFELRMSTELKDALAKRAAERGTSTAALLRLAAVTFLYGPDHVGILVAKRYGLGQMPAPSAVRTAAGAEQR